MDGKFTQVLRHHVLRPWFTEGSTFLSWKATMDDTAALGHLPVLS